jgi:hypothetical protein
MSLPSEYKKAPTTLYRGLGLTDNQLERLAKGKALKLNTRLLSSWSESIDVSLVFVGSSDTTIPELANMDVAEQGVVLRLKLQSQAVICNVGNLVQGGYVGFKDEENEKFAFIEQEVLIDSTKAHINSITPGNVVAVVYMGKTYRDKKVVKFFKDFSIPIEEKQAQKQLKEQYKSQLEEYKNFIDVFEHFFSKRGIKAHLPKLYKGEKFIKDFHILSIEPASRKTWVNIQNKSFASIKQDLKHIKEHLPDISHIVLQQGPEGDHGREDSLWVFFDKDLFKWYQSKVFEKSPPQVQYVVV